MGNLAAQELNPCRLCWKCKALTTGLPAPASSLSRWNQGFLAWPESISLVSFTSLEKSLRHRETSFLPSFPSSLPPSLLSSFDRELFFSSSPLACISNSSCPSPLQTGIQPKGCASSCNCTNSGLLIGRPSSGDGTSVWGGEDGELEAPSCVPDVLPVGVLSRDLLPSQVALVSVTCHQ